MPMGNLPLSEDEEKALGEFLKRNPNPLGEDEVKELAKRHLESDGWQVSVKAGKTHGVDVEATKGTARWVIEVKGYAGGKVEMQGEYFKDVLGEILQRMAFEGEKYSIAFPDAPRYRNLWEQLPNLAKRRTGISCLFVDKQGRVVECQATQSSPPTGIVTCSH